MTRVWALLAAALLACAPPGWPEAGGTVLPLAGPPLATSPAGRAFTQWLAAYNSGRTDSMTAAIARLYPASALERRSAPDRAAGLRLWYAGYGRFIPLRVDSLTPTAAVVTVRHALTDGWGVVYLDVDSVAPYSITGVGLLPFTEPLSWSELRVASEAELAARVLGLARRLAQADAFSGVVLLARNGRPLVREPFGLADRAAGRPNTAATRFELASVSKLFTAVAALGLIEEGRLALAATAGSVLPDLPAPAAGVSIRQLLTMASGIPDVFRSPRYWAERSSLRTLEDYWRFFAARPLEFPPGTSWSYSNSNSLLLGSLIERVTGEPFAGVVARRVFAPAGMAETTYHPVPALQRARGYTHLRPNSGPGAVPDPDRWYPAGAVDDTASAGGGGSPAGGGLSTADDLARFCRALIEHRLLGAELTRQALTGQVAAEYGGQDGYGFETRTWNGVRIVGHGGAFTGISNQVDCYPDLGYILVVLGNSDASGAQAIAHYVRAILASSPALAAEARPPR